MPIEEQTMLNFYYLKNLFQVLIESDLKLLLIQGKTLQEQFEEKTSMMPENFKQTLLEYYDVKNIFF